MFSSLNASSCSILVVLKDQTTLYMRPAAMLTKIANRFESDVVLEHEKARANGKSLLDIIMLGIGTGGSFKVFASGKDASGAIQAIGDFFIRFFIDGEVADAMPEDHARTGSTMNINNEQKEDEKMKQKKQTAVKQQQALVKQDNKKVQTFMWPLGNVKEVCLAGDFNNWKPEPMTKCDNGFRATVKLVPGLYQYKFVVDGQWQADPSAKGNAQNDFGTANSVLLVD